MLKNFFTNVVWPIIKPWLSEELDQAKTELIAASKQEFDEFRREAIPELVKAVVTAIGQSAGHFVVDGAGKVTSMIPGTADDKIVNGLINTILDGLGIQLP